MEYREYDVADTKRRLAEIQADLDGRLVAEYPDYTMIGALTEEVRGLETWLIGRV